MYKSCGLPIIGWMAFVEIDGVVEIVEAPLDRKEDLEKIVAGFGGCIFPVTDVKIVSA